MHILRSAFAIDDPDALETVARRGFGLLVGQHGDRPFGAHLPFVLHHRPQGTIVGFHVTQANPLAELGTGAARALLVVTTADAYVSNDWYATPDQVSTWLYESVHLAGTLYRRDASANRAHGDELLATCESRLAPKPPWRLDAMEPGKRAAMLGGIVVLELVVDTIEGQRKLNQHKPDADQIAVVRGLERSGDANARRIAGRMRALRPDLEYDPPPPT